MAQTKFDPDMGQDFQGRFNFVKVKSLDSASIGALAHNLVVDPADGFDIDLSWQVEGFLEPTIMGAAASSWQIMVIAESIGVDSDRILFQGTIPKNPASAGPDVYMHTVHITPAIMNAPATKLVEHLQGSNSGLYKISITVFINGAAGVGDIAGYHEGTMIMVEGRP